MPDPQPQARRAVHPGRIIAGLVLIAAGVLTFVNRSGLFDADAMQLFPGVIMMMFGVLRLSFECTTHREINERHNTLDGLWLVTVGAWLMVNAVHAFGLTYATSWPLLLMASGVFIVARSWGR